MLIKVNGVTINVTAVKMIKVDSKEATTYKKVSFFKRVKETKREWSCMLFYKDVDGDDATFNWHGAESREEAEAVERELLNQIKEVELEHMTATLESAMRKS